MGGMATLIQHIAELSADQHGVVTSRQLLDLGCKTNRIEYLRRTGVLLRVHRGAYRFAHVPPSHDQNVMAACLATGGVASGRTAARLFGLRGFENVEIIEITVEGKRAPVLKGVVSHATDSLERTTIGVIPVAMPAQILLGLCAVDSRLAEGAMNDVLVRRIASLPALVRFLQEHGASGRNGIARMRELVEAHVKGAKRVTWLQLVEEPGAVVARIARHLRSIKRAA